MRFESSCLSEWPSWIKFCEIGHLFFKTLEFLLQIINFFQSRFISKILQYILLVNYFCHQFKFVLITYR